MDLATSPFEAGFIVCNYVGGRAYGLAAQPVETTSEKVFVAGLTAHRGQASINVMASEVTIRPDPSPRSAIEGRPAANWAAAVPGRTRFDIYQASENFPRYADPHDLLGCVFLHQSHLRSLPFKSSA